MNVLYLVMQGVLDIPVLYLSRHIIRTKSDYYRLLQDVRTKDAWEEWVLYVLVAVEKTSISAIRLIQGIQKAMQDYKHRIRKEFKFYSQDLINNLFFHPYTKRDECPDSGVVLNWTHSIKFHVSFMIRTGPGFCNYVALLWTGAVCGARMGFYKVGQASLVRHLVRHSSQSDGGSLGDGGCLPAENQGS